MSLVKSQYYASITYYMCIYIPRIYTAYLNKYALCYMDVIYDIGRLGLYKSVFKLTSSQISEGLKKPRYNNMVHRY